VHENPNRCTRKERRGILRVIRWAAHSYLRLSISVRRANSRGAQSGNFCTLRVIQWAAHTLAVKHFR
jgi:hypothetical protein